ncbi:MAG: hypothetical protein ABIO51_07520 [Solirubrobacteraceae bacterium]
MARLLLLPAAAAPLAALGLLFADWFEPRGSFLVLFSNVDGVTFHPSAFDASSNQAALIAVLAVVTSASALVAARGRFVAWTAGAAASGLGAAVCLYLRESPPRPAPNVFTPPELALQPTTAPLIVTACLIFAGVCLTAWAMIAKRSA